MMPRALLRPGQIAWLSEIGLDTHWLATRTQRAARPAPAVSAPVPAQDEPGEGRPPAGHARATAGHGEALAGQAPSPPARVAPQAPAVEVAAPTDCPDVAALGLAVSACGQCERHGQRARAVPGAGQAVRPYYLVIGEQPGIEDDTAGQLFLGDQGRLLAAMLAAARLPHADSVFLTHVVKCRAVGGREPSPQEIAACLPWLRRQIALLRPRWILALGRVAAQVVTGMDADLDGLRGGPHRHTPDQGDPIPVWVTHQPSSLLVRCAWKAEAWRDLAGLARAVNADQEA